MSDLVVRKVEATSRTWREEAEKRRKISKLDPVAEVLDYCAGEISAVLRDARSEIEYITVDELAARERVTPQTVRTWIRREIIPAQWGPKGYQIPKDARVPRRKAS